MKYNELKRILIKNGCYIKCEKTNHEWWFSPITKNGFTVSRHGKQEVAPGTLKSIEKLSGVNL